MLASTWTQGHVNSWLFICFGPDSIISSAYKLAWVYKLSVGFETSCWFHSSIAVQKWKGILRSPYICIYRRRDYVYVYIYIHTCIHTYIRIHIYIYISDWHLLLSQNPLGKCRAISDTSLRRPRKSLGTIWQADLSELCAAGARAEEHSGACHATRSTGTYMMVCTACLGMRGGKYPVKATRLPPSS